MEVRYKINQREDAELAAKQCLAIAATYDGPAEIHVEPVVPEPVATEQPPPAKSKRGGRKAPVNGEDTAVVPLANDELIKLARENGVLWVRQILTQYGVNRIPELTAEQVAEILHAAA